MLLSPAAGGKKQHHLMHGQSISRFNQRLPGRGFGQLKSYRQTFFKRFDSIIRFEVIFLILQQMWNNITRLITQFGSSFLIGTANTLLLSLITVFFGAIFGTLIAFAKMGRFKPLSWLATGYIEVIRGTPLLLQLYFFYFLLPMLLPVFDNKFLSIALALICNSAAYVSEIVRAGIQAVDKGQSEASRSLGLSKKQTMIKIVLPQAVKNILPALGNEFVMVIKETSLASTFFVGDLMTQHKTLSGALAMTIEPLIIIGLIYFFLTFTLSKIIAMLERRLQASD
jgi:His/Glu/Gln/Arg/opine family amino acid ABC transporter permease subunit